MKKIFVAMMCLAVMMASNTGLKAQEVTITLNPGWTWISVPLMDTLDFPTALGSFTPMQGDIIKSQNGNATYMSNGLWRGSILQFYPGYGYMYKSNRTVPVSVIFQAQQSNPQNNVPMGAIAGLFSVSESQQVYFSQGNLQYQASTNTWRFAENQWDCLRLENANISSSYDGWIDLFGWGTSGYDHGAVCYQPWSTSTSGSYYYAYGSSSYNLYDQTGKADWGYNAISNGGNTENHWRTLTSDEWSYLIFNRDTPSGIRFVKAVVNNIEGLVVLPDNWDSSYYDLNETNNASANYSANVVIENDWINVLEANGAVFLPAGSYRNGSSYIEQSNPFKAYYWTSSNVNYVEFNNTQLFVGGRWRDNGLSVRLVSTVQDNSSYTINTTCSPAEGGTVTGVGTYNAGETCTLTATANEGYTFTNWTENGNVVSTNTNYSFTVTTSRTLVANFAAQSTPIIHTISVSANPMNGGIVTGGGTYNQGQSCTVHAMANTGYIFINWTENGNVVSTDANYTFTVNADRTLVANFAVQSIPIYSISVSANPSNGGSVSGGGTYHYNEECTVHAIANTGYTFANWSEDGIVVSIDADYIFYVNYSRNLVANFTVQSYAISTAANPSNGGSILGGGVFNYGQSCTVQAIANTGYTFTNWTVNGSVVSTNANYTFIVTSNATLVANFTAQSYTISVSADPSSGGNVSGGGTYIYGQSCTVHATANTGYTFTNWTVNGSTVSTNANYTFTVTGNRVLVAHFNYNSSGGHEYVDLGLPSGLLWATCNVGADTPEEYGDYFAWGETQPKDYYYWSTYQYWNVNYLTKYCNNSNFGYNGFTDDLTTLLPEDDAATANWGSGWRMPTKEEWQELYTYTTNTFVEQNGVLGRLFTGWNGNTLFMPVAGHRYKDSLYYAGRDGNYWSSSLNADDPHDAWWFGFASGYYGMYYHTRVAGQPVRAVRSSQN